MRRLALAAFLLLAALAAGTAGLGLVWYGRPGPLESPLRLVVMRGEGVDAIAGQLAKAGVIDYPLPFAVAARLTRHRGELKAGEYEIPTQASPRAVLALFRSGRTVVHHLTVPEGLTTDEVLALVDHAPALTGVIERRPDEGALFPSTYNYSWGDSRQGLVDRMRRKMSSLVAALWAKRQPGLVLATPEAAVTLASIVEKETALPAERPKIAGVFYNRLARGMKLQSDPTVIYALTQGRGPLGRPLVHDDLAVASPYNTYLVTGLPPGPIDNPGEASIEAVLQPEQTDALYFVADGSGGHAFAATLDKHNQNVASWRRHEAEKK